MTTIDPAPAPDDLRSRLAVALDVDDAVAALRLAKEVRPWFGVAKVGIELYSAAGPDILSSLRDLGYDVFADLKFHDIPTTVERAARVVGALGVGYLNFHSQGGEAMLRAGVEGLHEGAARAGLPVPAALAVTVLTSDPDASEAVLGPRVERALAAGCDGVVCAATDVALVRSRGRDLLTMVPGIRPAGADVHDQSRTATPAEALAAGADVMILGRAVTRADDPAAAAAAVVESLEV